MYRSNHFESQNDVSGSSGLEASIHTHQNSHTHQNGLHHQHNQRGDLQNHQSISPAHNLAYGSDYSQPQNEPNHYAELYPEQRAAVQRHNGQVQNGLGASVSRSLPPQFPASPNPGNVKDKLPALPHSSLSTASLTQAASPTTELGFADFRADAFEDNEVDTQISALFNAMGRASKLSQSQLAMRLQTTQEVIQALEAGRLGMLPDWEEIAPVVVRYAKYMNIDERPILRRLREQLTEHFLQRMTREKKQSALHSTGLNSQALTSQCLNQNYNPAHELSGRDHDRHYEQLPNGTQKKDVSVNGFAPKLSPLPRTDQTLKAIATGAPTKSSYDNGQAGAAVHNSIPAIEDRLAALVSATSQSFSNFDNNAKLASANFATHSQALRTEMKQPIANNPQNSSLNHSQGSPCMFQGKPQSASQFGTDYMAGSQNNGQHSNSMHSSDQSRAFSNGHVHGGQMSSSPQHNSSYMDLNESSKKNSKWLRVVGNIAFVLILLIGFINWQPNRFWSGVDQLPKPIAKTIYDLFEFVMPDPLASVYRMNWVYVDDPRMRKSDKLLVPTAMKLPKLDFSNLGTMSK